MYGNPGGEEVTWGGPVRSLVTVRPGILEMLTTNPGSAQRKPSRKSWPGSSPGSYGMQAPRGRAPARSDGRIQAPGHRVRPRNAWVDRGGGPCLPIWPLTALRICLLARATQFKRLREILGGDRPPVGLGIILIQEGHKSLEGIRIPHARRNVHAYLADRLLGRQSVPSGAFAPLRPP